MMSLLLACSSGVLGAEYYVDRAASGPHDGLSWETAWTNMRSATRANLAPGDTVWIRPGIYPEKVYITNSGAILVEATNVVAIVATNRIVFPAGVDLSLWTNLSGLAVGIYRSLAGNNGLYDIAAMSPTENIVCVHGKLHHETPWNGDEYPVCAALLRPIRWRNAGPQPITNRVRIDVSSVVNPSTTFYLGLAIGDGSADAWPANAHVFEGLDITGSTNGGGVHLQCGNYNTFIDCRVYETAKTGFLIAGNTNRPARYNMLWRCSAWNTPYETVYIGAGGQGWDRNHARFTHVIDGEFFTTSGPRALLENAVDVKEGNIGSFLTGNIFRDARLVSGGNGLVDIRPRADHTWVIGNRFLNFEAGGGSSPRGALMVYESNRAVRIAHNLIYTSSTSNTLVGLRLQEGHHEGNQFVFNTVVGPRRGALYEYYSGVTGGWLIANNIWDARVTPYTVWGSQGGLTLSHNLYSSNPLAEYAGEPGRLVANPLFRDRANGDLRLTASSPAVNSGLPVLPYELDVDGYLRDHEPDRGAHEFDDPRLAVDPALPTYAAEGDAFRLIWRSRTPCCEGVVRWYLRPAPPNDSNLTLVTTAVAGLETNALVSLLPFAPGDYTLAANVEACGSTSIWHEIAGVVQVLADLDGDGLPAWWETLYFGGPTQAHAQALCANNLNTLQEAFIAGLDPLNPAARLSTSLREDGNSHRLEWTPFAPGRRYQVLAAGELNLPFSLVSEVALTNFMQMELTNMKAFYHTRVRLAP